jgi:hypothetical protein
MKMETGWKVGKKEQTGEVVQDNTQSATLLKRGSGNISIGTQREQKSTEVTSTISETKTETENSFNKAKTIPKQELSQRLSQGFSDLNLGNEDLILVLPPEPPPLPPKHQGSGTNVQNSEGQTVQSELKQFFDKNKIEYSGSDLEKLDKSVSGKHLENAKEFLKVEKTMEIDKNVLSETTYKDKSKSPKIKDISDNEISEFLKGTKVRGSHLTSLVHGNKLTSFVSELDMTSQQSKGSVYNKARETSKKMTAGLDPDMSMAIKLRSDSELKDIIANSIAVKDKYHQSHEVALSKYTEAMGKFTPKFIKFEDLYKIRPRTDELKVELKQLLNEMYDIGIENKLFNKVPKERGYGIKIEDLKPPPSIYKSLPVNKQKLVDSILDGMKQGIPDKASPEKITFKLDHNMEMPKSITLNGKTYVNPEYLAKGGIGAVFKYTNQDNPDDTVVIKNLMDSSKKEEMITEIKNHIHATNGEDNNKNVINLKGIVKGNGTELYMVMETAKGDAQGVFDKFDDLKKNNIISPKTYDLLKNLLSKDMMEGMLYLQKERNMIHLDLKPGNYLMNKEGRAVVSDFGTSRRTTDAFNLKYNSQNPIFASPEALSRNLNNNDEKLLITEKSDIWTLGVFLHDINYGSSKLEDSTFMSKTEENILEFSKNDKNRLIDNETNPLDTLINSMTHPDPRQRPTLEAVLNSSFFKDPDLEKPGLREIIKEMSSKTPDLEKIKLFSQEIDK